MDYTKLIHDFMDGNLDVEQEEQMFYQFSANDELRSELKQQIAIREAIRNDSRAYTPAANSTVGVFSALGFNPPSTVIEPAAQVGKSNLASFLSKYRQGLISGLVSVVATTAVFLFFMNPFVKETSGSVGNTRTSIAQTQVIPNNIPKVESFANDEQQTKVRYITKVRYVDVPRFVDNSHSQNQQENTNVTTTPSDLNNTELTSAEISNVSSPKFDRESYNGLHELGNGSTLNGFNDIIIPNQDLGISVELLGSQYWNMEEELINPLKYQTFNNAAVALYYNLSDNFAIGAEYRRENFYQKFESSKHDTIFQQQPNFETYGLNLRYTLPYELWSIYPFVQFNGGINNAGFTVRPMFGLKYSPYKNITLSIGGETSLLRYHHKNNWYNTSKIGFNYGIMFNF